MTVPTVACTNCGKPFTTDDLRGTSCRYCGTLLAHHARAQQQVAVVREMLGQNFPQGVPPYAPPPYGMPYAPPPQAYYANAMNAANLGQDVTRAVSRAMVIVIVVIALILFLSFGAGFAFYLVAR